MRHTAVPFLVLLAQPTHAFFSDSLVAMPPAVARAYQHYCARLVGDSTAHWRAELDSFEPDPTFKFAVTGQYLHHDSRLAEPFSVELEAEFNARGAAIRYAYEVPPDSLPWLTRRGVRRVARRNRRQHQELCLLVATVQPAPVRRERLTYTAYFMYTDEAGKQQVAEQRLQRNGRAAYVYQSKFRHW